MTKKLYVTPTDAHNLAGRVVAILKGGGLRDRPTLNRVHEIVERQANDPAWIKRFLNAAVDQMTKADDPVNHYATRVRQDIRAEATPGFDYDGLLSEVIEDTGGYEVCQGEEIRSLTDYDASPATDLGETWSFPAYQSDDAPGTTDADESRQVQVGDPVVDTETTFTLPTYEHEEDA